MLFIPVQFILILENLTIPDCVKQVSLSVIGHKKSRVHLQKQKLAPILQLV